MEKCATNNKIIRLADILFFTGLLLISLKAMHFLFYHQAITVDDLYFSDIKAYIQEIVGENDLYSFPYPIMFDVAKIILKFSDSPEAAMAWTVTFFNALGIIVVKVFITNVTDTYILSTIATFGLFFDSMIYSDWISNRVSTMGSYYLGIFSPNPWHNATYMAARPFMVITFIFGAITLNNYKSDFSKKISKENILLYVIFSISLLLTTLTKPSYTIIHLLATFVIVVFRLLVNKLKGLKETIIYSLLFIPTLIDLLYQFFGVFSGQSYSGENNGVGIGLFRVWNKYTNCFPISLILGCAFPMLVLIFHIKDLKEDKLYRFSWQIYLAGLLSSVIFYEKGFREGHFNFAWGYMCGLFIVFLTATITMINDIKMIILQKKMSKMIFVIIGEVLLFIIHSALGIHWFILFCEGNSYI